MRADIDAAALLALWERAIAVPPALRGDGLLDASGDAGMRADVPRTLGGRNRGLFALHRRLFGGVLELRSQCPACDAVAQFSADTRALADALPPGQDTPDGHFAEAGFDLQFRLPTASDLAALGAEEDAERGARRLLERCVSCCRRDGTDVPLDDVPAVVLAALSGHMEALDPGASLTFDVSCPTCATRWDAPFDPAQALWALVQAAAERVLLDIDALARAYGWTEPEVLALSPTRRAAYLQLVRG